MLSGEIAAFTQTTGRTVGGVPRIRYPQQVLGELGGTMANARLLVVGSMHTGCGEGPFGRELRRDLKSDGIDAEFLARRWQTTGAAVMIFNGAGGQGSNAVLSGPNGSLTRAEVPSRRPHGVGGIR